MNFKCLINLLEEKNYIKRDRVYKLNNSEKGKVIGIKYNCKYEEVKWKIVEEIETFWACAELSNITYEVNDSNNVKYLTDCDIRIVFIDNLKEEINKHMKGQETLKIKPGYIGNLYLKDIFANDTDYFVKITNNGNWEITDLKKKAERMNKEKQEKKECLEFLNQLP